MFTQGIDGRAQGGLELHPEQSSTLPMFTQGIDGLAQGGSCCLEQHPEQ